jgi:hypothetical protein
MAVFKARLDMNFDGFEASMKALVDKVDRGTKKATIAACEEILDNSLQEVPRDTETLANSAYYEIKGAYKNFTGEVGYGGNGDPVNPKSGKPASNYALVVHEDLGAAHTVGKAKFLEDPVRRYAGKFVSRATKVIRAEID